MFEMLFTKCSVKHVFSRCDWADVRSGRSFVSLVTLLAQSGVYDLQSIDLILDEADKCDFDDLTTDRGLANAIDFLFRLNIPFVRDVGNSHSYVVKFIERNRALCLRSLLQVLELDTLRQIYRLPVSHSLAAAKQRRLSDFFQTDDNVHGLADMEDASGKICADSAHARALNFLYRDLFQILGGEARVKLAYPLPYSNYRCLVFRLDTDGQPMKLDSSDNFSGLACRGEADSWRLVLLPKRGEVGKDGRLLGQVKRQLVELRELGYSPIILNWSQYCTALKQKKNLSFLRRTINIHKT
jgi:hypothetical protein